MRLTESVSSVPHSGTLLDLSQNKVLILFRGAGEMLSAFHNIGLCFLFDHANLFSLNGKRESFS